MGIVITQKPGRKGSVNDKLERSYTQEFQVIAGDALDADVGLLLLWPTLPKIGWPYIEMGGFVDPGAICKSIKPESVDGSRIEWKVVCEYSSVTVDPQQQDEDPLKQPPEISLDFEETKFAVEEDLDGTPIMNTAGEPFDAQEVTLPIAVLTIRRNEANFDFAQAVAYAGATNEDPFWGSPPGIAKMAIKVERQFKKGKKYFQVTYVAKFSPIGWKLRLLNAGFRELDPNGHLVAIYDINAQPVSAAVPLDDTGQKMNAQLVAIGAQKPIYQTFKMLPSKPFGALNLPGGP